MTTTKSIKEKLQFIRWFTKNYALKSDECKFILNYLCSNDEMLKKLHFVEKARGYKKCMTISSLCSNELPFKYMTETVIIRDPKVAFELLKENEDEIYLEIDFKNKYRNAEYLNIIIEDENNKRTELSKEEKREIEYFLDEIVIKNEIEKALAENNKEKFIELTQKLKKDECKG